MWEAPGQPDLHSYTLSTNKKAQFLKITQGDSNLVSNFFFLAVLGLNSGPQSGAPPLHQPSPKLLRSPGSPGVWERLSRPPLLSCQLCSFTAEKDSLRRHSVCIPYMPVPILQACVTGSLVVCFPCPPLAWSLSFIFVPAPFTWSPVG